MSISLHKYCCLLLFSYINSADYKSLQSLRGIGTKTAGRIIEYRQNKCFDSVEEIVKVKGIGKKTLEKISPMIEAAPCEGNTTM